MAAAVALSSFGLGACDDLDDATDDADDEPVTQEAYDDEAARLCERFVGDVVDIAAEMNGSESDAERISLLRAEFVPNLRAIVQSLETFGYPPDQAATYSQAEAVALNRLDEIEDEAPELVDRMMAGTLLPEEDPFVRLEEALVALDVPC